ncbi:helix-turn-helix domain-containing protein, partial [Vibrio genomosp. F6]|uniref:helix-turn-helix domain-containing protein n=1 Tax=Vibrio genomosp. F6 TaxID=723172 RepID=UPI0004923898
MKYSHLTENERYMISALRKQGISTAKIARQLGRHKATIYREIERSSRYDRYLKRYSYQAWRAQQMA